jgi:diguanylate cyclase (GGDEF)-like protein
MNPTILTNLFALATFIGTFWPLARRAGPHARIWLLGWAFLLLHTLALFFDHGTSPRACAFRLIALATTQLCALSFIRGSVKITLRPIALPFMAAMALPLLLQSTLLTFGVHSYPLYVATALLMLVPALYVLAGPARRTRSQVQIAIAFVLLAAVSIPFTGFNPAHTVDNVLCILFLLAAFLYLTAATRISRGVIMAVLGLATKGLTYPLLTLLAWYDPSLHIEGAFLDLPLYCVAYGMILTLLEEHLGRTEQLALADPLTGLPNTRHFEDRFARALAASTIHGNPIACLVIDVDNFKRVNDTLGHPVGDELLKALAVRLAWHIGPRDTLARTGGDEFTAILVGGNDEHHLRFIARAMMSATSVPVAILGHSVPVNLSIGIAVSTPETPNLSALRKAADDAMYHAKRSGGSSLSFFGEAS